MGTISLVHRYYDPATEQFISVDPLVDETGTPYAYVGGDPVNNLDRLGLCDVPSGDPNQPFTHTHNGPCTGAEAHLIETQANAIRNGTSIYAGEASAGGGIGFQVNPLQGLEGGANFFEGIGNSILGSYVNLPIRLLTFGQFNPNLHIKQLPFQSCNPFVGTDYRAGENVGNIYTFIPSPPKAATVVTTSIYVGILRNFLKGW